jgi:hypothetical protein
MPTVKEAKAKAAEAIPEDAALVNAIAGSEDVELEVLDPDAASEAIVRRIMAAEDTDALSAVAESGALDARSVLNTPLRILDVAFSKSAFDEGPKVFALIRAFVLDTGAEETITCGSRNVMAALLRLKQLGQLPTQDAWVIVEADRPTAGGFYPMWLRKAG